MAAPKKAVGPKSDKLWRDAIMRAVRRNKGKKGKRLELLADKCVEEGLDGNMAAIREIGDRLDGKPSQGITVSGDEDNPLQIIKRVIIRPSDKNG